ncbi:MAG: hypothetical protein K0Q66_451, partial [Chitinophagaceae bacterium]|nr:hypothetical protein [Chitinophagaceae bacterium]
MPNTPFTPDAIISVILTATNGVGDTARYSFTVTRPIIEITASDDLSFCAGDSIALTATEGVAYLWSTGATTRSITVSTAGSYFVTVTDAGGCATTTDAVEVTVNPLPTVNAGSDVTICPGGTVTLSATTNGDNNGSGNQGSSNYTLCIFDAGPDNNGLFSPGY